MKPIKFNVTLPVMPGKLAASNKIPQLSLDEDFALRRKRTSAELAHSPASCNDILSSAMDIRGTIDLRNRDLRGVDFRGACLKFSLFDGADLRDADFRGANLVRASFSKADLRGTDFRGADCANADMTGAKLALADFRGAANVGCITFQESYDEGVPDFSLTLFHDFKAEQVQSVAKLTELGLTGLAEVVATRTTFPGSRSNTAF